MELNFLFLLKVVGLIFLVFFLVKLFLTANKNRSALNYLNFEIFVSKLYQERQLEIENVLNIYIKNCNNHNEKIIIPKDFPLNYKDTNFKNLIIKSPFAIIKNKLVINEKISIGFKLVKIKEYFITNQIIIKFPNFSEDEILLLLMIIYTGKVNN